MTNSLRHYIKLVEAAMQPDHPDILLEKRVVLDPDRDMVVWENPSATELRGLLDQFGELRGGAAPNGSLWVWDADNWVHGTIHKYVGYLPYYLYFSKKRAVRADEWRRPMKRMGDIWVGIKYDQPDERGRDKARPDIVLDHDKVKRAVGL